MKQQLRMAYITKIFWPLTMETPADNKQGLILNSLFNWKPVQGSKDRTMCSLHCASVFQLHWFEWFWLICRVIDIFYSTSCEAESDPAQASDFTTAAAALGDKTGSSGFNVISLNYTDVNATVCLLANESTTDVCINSEQTSSVGSVFPCT